MATGVIGEAALGAVIGEVLKVVTNVKKKALKFKPILERLESTLEFVIPKINEMERLSKTYNYHTKKDTGIGTFELIMLLQKGEELLHKCSRVSRWNYWKKYQYSNKLLELEASLFRFCLLNLQVEESKDIKLILVKMEELNLRLDRFNVRGRKGISRASSVDSNISDLSWFSAEDGDGECSNGQILPASNLRVFTLSELKAATKNFRPDSAVGEGGFGKVFKGWLNENGRGSTTVIAVKKLSSESMQGFHEWQSEVNFLGGLSHPNLIKLLGYCWEDNELLLIYEFMQVGSLETLLFKRTDQPLPWDRRLKILIGAARGMAFLHTLEKPVIYRDFKTSNILLDESYTAKLSDFGLAKMGPLGDQSHVMTSRVIGTYGYAAPEYIATGHLYIKSDVYGFGVVMVEMLTGLRAIDMNRPREKHNLVNWVKPYLSSRRKVKKIIDIRMMGRYSSKAVEKAAHLALKCLQSEPESRPSMEEIVEKLERIEAAKEKPH